jgi:CheY-like chemotaxis protein
LLVELLSGVGFDVRLVTDGAAAVEAFTEWSPHLVCMDLRMPVLDGIEATRRIRGLAGGASAVVIALTASAFEEDRALVLEAGCDDFIRKPLREEELFAAIGRHLGVVFRSEPLVAEAPAVASAAGLADGEVVARLAVVSASLRQAVEAAAVLGDADRLERLLAEATEVPPPLAVRLRGLVDDFRFDRILELAPPCRRKLSPPDTPSLLHTCGAPKRRS